MELFEFDSYKKYVLAWIESKPNRGRGLFRRLAEHLRVNPVYISQTLKGPKDLSLEQGFAVCEYLGLNDLEREYFLLLIQIERAGTQALKEFHLKRLRKLRRASQDLRNRVIPETEMTEAAKAVFYSNWSYSAVRLLSGVTRFGDEPAIAARLGLPLAQVHAIAEFLVRHGLCIQEGGRLRMGPRLTHLESDSPWIKTRQIDWRVKGFERMEQKGADELFYTGPMSLSPEAFTAIRRELVRLIEEASRLVGETEPEGLACLNIDWFRV
jgi:hypothetical protein